jgi:hypothetical protein
MKKSCVHLLGLQSSAARPQPAVTDLVHFAFGAMLQVPQRSAFVADFASWLAAG